MVLTLAITFARKGFTSLSVLPDVAFDRHRYGLEDGSLLAPLWFEAFL